MLRFLTRRGCHLCDEARPLVLIAAEEADAEVDEVDIDSDEALQTVYGSRVPVLLGPDDRVLAEGVIDDRSSLRSAIRRSGSA